MKLTQYFSLIERQLSFTELQGSEFAKQVAGDFNPLHDPGVKRYCVPGDLLFSVLLHHYGVYKFTQVAFAHMIDASLLLTLDELQGGHLDIQDQRDRKCVSMQVRGESTANEKFINALSCEYVQFSGKTFPDILVDLMRRSKVMINPARPLVIYKDMAITLSRLDGQLLALELSGASLQVTGKKGTVCLSFTIRADGEEIGFGEKNMVLGGLREFDEAVMVALVDEYNQRKLAFRESHHAM